MAERVATPSRAKAAGLVVAAGMVGQEIPAHLYRAVAEIREGVALGVHVIDRCNLTVFFVDGKRHLPTFLRDHQVEITASLPCYTEENVDKQRGKGVFTKSIEALRLLDEWKQKAFENFCNFTLVGLGD